MKIRVIKTASNASAVQVIRYQNNKRIILQHIGSAYDDKSLNELVLVAEEWIKNCSGQLSIFPNEHPNSLLHLSRCSFVGVKYHFFYNLINTIGATIGFGDLPSLLTQKIH
jgi:hypothetical protein